MPSGANADWCANEAGDTELVATACEVDPAECEPEVIIEDGATVTFSLGDAGETPAVFQKVHPLRNTDAFVLTHTVTDSNDVVRNGVFVYSLVGDFLSKYIFSDVPGTTINVHPISASVIIVERARVLYFLKLSSDYMSLTLENTFNVSSSVNGIAVGRFGNTEHPRFFVIDQPVDDHFGLCYSWKPAQKVGSANGNPVRFKYFQFRYNGSSDIATQVMAVYPPADEPSLGHVGGYIGGDNVYGNAKYDINRADAFGKYGAVVHAVYGDGRDGVSYIILNYDPSTGTVSKQVEPKFSTGRWSGTTTFPAVNQWEDDLCVIRSRYEQTFRLDFYDTETLKILKTRTYDAHTSPLRFANVTSGGGAEGEIIMSVNPTGTKTDLTYFLVNADSPVTTMTGTIVQGDTPIKHYMFDDPFLMIAYEGEDGAYTMKYVVP